MSVTSGFYNSKSGDRTYNAKQMGTLLGGVIKDGVIPNFPAEGNQFVVTNSGLTVTVGPGRAWFHDTWLDNDGNETFSVPEPSPIYTRKDRIYIKIDQSNAGPTQRSNRIVYMAGTPSSNPSYWTPTQEDSVYWYPLVDIVVAANATSVSIEKYYVGAEDGIPICQCPLDHISAPQSVLAGWKEEVDDVVEEEVDSFLNNQNSVLSSLIRVIPAIWLYDQDISPVAGQSNLLTYDAQGQVWTGRLYPDFMANHTVAQRNVPKAHDIVVGKNGYYADISYSNASSGSDSYSITAISTGKAIGDTGTAPAASDIFLITFSCPSIEMPHDTTDDLIDGVYYETDDVACDKTWDEIEAAYAAGKKIVARIVLYHNQYHDERGLFQFYAYAEPIIYTEDNDRVLSGVGVSIFANLYCSARVASEQKHKIIQYNMSSDSISAEVATLYNPATLTSLQSQIPRSATYDNETGYVSFKNASNQTLFTLEFNIYNGSVTEGD